MNWKDFPIWFLQELARKNNCKGYSGLTKEKLIELLKKCNVQMPDHIPKQQYDKNYYANQQKKYEKQQRYKQQYKQQYNQQYNQQQYNRQYNQQQYKQQYKQHGNTSDTNSSGSSQYNQQQYNKPIPAYKAEICRKILCNRFGVSGKQLKNIDFKKWSLRNHPDKGGDSAIFQETSSCWDLWKDNENLAPYC